MKTEIGKEVKYVFGKNHAHKIVFDHLPKCAGTALNVYLMSHYPRRKIFVIDGVHSHASVERFKMMSERRRHRYDLVIGHYANELFDFVHPDCLKITVLREPIDRIVSHYYYVVSREKHYLHQQVKERHIGLEAYADPDLSPELSNWYTTHFSGCTLSAAHKEPDAVVDKALSVLSRQYDIVGFLDEFDQFIRRLKQAAMLTNEYTDVKVNVTGERPGVNGISQRARESIASANQLDITLYRLAKERLV